MCKFRATGGEMSRRFLQIVLTAGATDVVFLALAKPFKRLAGGVE